MFDYLTSCIEQSNSTPTNVIAVTQSRGQKRKYEEGKEVNTKMKKKAKK
jgi:hypothetical protein